MVVELNLETDRSIAVVHEWLSARAGSEILFEQLASIFPTAELFALTRNPDVEFDLGDRDLGLSVLQWLGKGRERRGVLLPLMPLAWKMMPKGRFDVVVSSSHGFAREFARGRANIHCNYVHSPMRYAWTPGLDGRGELGGVLSKPARSVLKRVDTRTVEGTTAFAANSVAVRSRVREFYGRDAEVIHPPVEVEYFESVSCRKEDFVVAASRWIPYKRLDLAIRAAAKVGVAIKVVGSGPSESHLRSVAREFHPHGTEFVLQPSRSELRLLMAKARAFVFPAHEDFGIIAVEAQAAGTPVVGLSAGGTLDTVKPGVTGYLADSQSVDSFAVALQDCLEIGVDRRKCREHARSFSKARFDDEIKRWVSGAVTSV